MITSHSAIILRKVRGEFGAFFRTGFHITPAGGRGLGAAPTLLTALAAFALIVAPAIVILAVFAFLGAVSPASSEAGLVLANATLLAAAPAGIKAKHEALRKLHTELREGQEKMAAGSITPAEGSALDQKAAEAMNIQGELDRWVAVEQVRRAGMTIDSPIMPAGAGDEAKGEDDVVGYITLGNMLTGTKQFADFARDGYPTAREVVVSFQGGSFHKGRSGFGLIPVTRKMLESKATPTVGASVIRPDRQGDVVRFAERDRTILRDILNVAQTDSNSIEYVTIGAVTQAAAPVAEGAVKPEAALTFGTATAPVRTIAVTMPVTEQQLQDVPNLQNTIDTELTYDLRKTEERQVLWGDGTGQNLLGVYNTPGVAAGRVVGGDTLIDKARRLITDVAVANLEPNALVLDPLDWETILLTKGTDNNYIWAVVTDDNGSRLWNTRVIETTAAREPGTFTTNERRMLVGDFIRGATLWDRQQAGMQIGYVNDQFLRNMRTIRVEERLAFGVKRPAAFRYYITQARVA